MSEQEGKFSRRDFLGAVTAVSTVVVAAQGCSKPSAEMPALLAQAPDGAPIKAGLIGCGGRGTGAANDFLKAGNNLVVTALCDPFQDRLDSCRENLKKAGQNIADDHCFVGLDGYKKVIESGVDLVIMATPPYFRPQHFAAAIDAGKHVFMEKPVSVDPVGTRKVLEYAEKATQKGLSVVTGNQRRNQYHYLKALKYVRDGAIGELVGGQVYWNQAQLWYRERQKGWSDMEWMIRDWVNWLWLSGDHIVEQHVHNIDVMNWFMNSHPVKAVGMGGRARRVTGDQYDFFAVDYEMASGVHAMSMCRQINGCVNNVSETMVGSKGVCSLSGGMAKLVDAKGKIIWEWNKDNEPEKNPYEQEHITLVTAIRSNKPVNMAKDIAESVLTAIMGRTAAYTGKLVTWEEMMQSTETLGVANVAMGPVPELQTLKVAIQGIDKK